MARIETDPNYTVVTFPRATAATDLFKKEDVQKLAEAVSGHDHSAGKGVVLGAASIPPGTITSGMIADGAIGTADIANGAITTEKIAPSATTAWALVGQSADVTTTNSASYVDVPGLSATLTTTGGLVVIEWQGPLHQTVAGAATVTISQDGLDQAVLCQAQVGGQPHNPSGFIYSFMPAAGSHTYKLRLKTSPGGTANMHASQVVSTLVVTEFKR